MEHSQLREQGQDTVAHCHWHPDVETGLSCSHCGKPICPQCMVQAPVGIRCRECGKSVRMPTFDVQPAYYARAIGAAIAVAMVGGLLWSGFIYIFGAIPYIFTAIPFLPGLAALGLGYGTGELISLSVNRKRSKGLAWIAGSSVGGAFLITWLIIGPFFGSPFGLLLIIAGVVVAVQRVR